MPGLFLRVLALGAATMLTGCRGAAQAQNPAGLAAGAEASAVPSQGLMPVSAFSRIADPKARSIALFVEAGRVIAHPRCVNCHPADGIPRQGMEQQLHLPKVHGGSNGHGTPGLPCASCHQERNVQTVGASVQSIPGNPKWALAPAEMAWVGKPLGQICEQLKDPQRNGGKSLEQLHHHMAEDVLVGWGWAPGPGREPVPGTQQAFGELVRAWIDTGAACPVP